MSMTISVKLFASLAKYKPSHVESASFVVELNEGATVGELASELGIPKDKIRTISLNSKIVKIQAVLEDGDYLILFPAIAGG